MLLRRIWTPTDQAPSTGKVGTVCMYDAGTHVGQLLTVDGHQTWTCWEVVDRAMHPDGTVIETVRLMHQDWVPFQIVSAEEYSVVSFPHSAELQIPGWTIRLEPGFARETVVDPPEPAQQELPPPPQPGPQPRVQAPLAPQATPAPLPTQPACNTRGAPSPKQKRSSKRAFPSQPQQANPEPSAVPLEPPVISEQPVSRRGQRRPRRRQLSEGPAASSQVPTAPSQPPPSPQQTQQSGAPRHSRVSRQPNKTKQVFSSPEASRPISSTGGC